MKTITVSPILAGLVLSSSAWAQPAGEGNPRKEGKPVHRMMDAWKQADADGDGFLSMEEFSSFGRVRNLPDEKKRRLFARLDKDGDGRIGPGEVAPPPRNRGEGMRKLPKLWELDTDKNGSVSFEEFGAGKPFAKFPEPRRRIIFDRLDSNGDGVISPADRPERFRRGEGKASPERPRDGGPEAKHRNSWRALDGDKDGALSFEEFRNGPGVRKLGEDEQEDRFLALDRNGDHKLTPDEMDAKPRPKKGSSGGGG